MAPAEGAAEQRGSQVAGSTCPAGKEAATKHFPVVAVPMFRNEKDFTTDNLYPKKFNFPVS